MGAKQFIRHCTLVVAGTSGEGLDLSQMRIGFDVKKTDAQTPNTAEIVVFNLSANTVKQIRKEFTRVILQAGYGENFGVIFDGNIKELVSGKEGTDTTLSISAGDGDRAYKVERQICGMRASGFRDRTKVNA